MSADMEHRRGIAAGLALVIAEPMRARFQQERDVTAVSRCRYK